ncbi:unnamed protein product [marine sediment metagenome]|uniref:Uncharacterized protein n=1 Tax=marine sediment metagenome TaxID=412755 RepID=X1UKF0_9ZZZZ
MSNCPHCGHRHCAEFIRDTEEGELVTCGGCGQDYVIRSKEEIELLELRMKFGIEEEE